MDNFCFDVTLSYRRLERPRRLRWLPGGGVRLPSSRMGVRRGRDMGAGGRPASSTARAGQRPASGVAAAGRIRRIPACQIS